MEEFWEQETWERAMSEFYEQCLSKGYIDMRDMEQSLKAKVIATDLGLNYGNMVRFFEKAKTCHQKIEKEKEIQRKRDGERAAREAVKGTLLVTMMDTFGGANKKLSVSVFLRPDGSVYSIFNDGERLEGPPDIHVKKGGYLSYTYNPSEIVYTGVTVGSVHTGGFHQTQESYSEHMNKSGKGYIEVGTEGARVSVSKITMGIEIQNRFGKDAEYRSLTDGGSVINCYQKSEISDYMVNSAIMGSGDIYSRTQMLTMAADERRIPYEKCVRIARLLGRIVNVDLPADDVSLYTKAETLSEANTSRELAEAIAIFQSISDFRDAAERAGSLKIRYEQVLQAEKEQNVIRRERNKKIIIVISILIAAMLIIVALLCNPNNKKMLCEELQNTLSGTSWENQNKDRIEFWNDSRCNYKEISTMTGTYKVVSAKNGKALVKLELLYGRAVLELEASYNISGNGKYIIMRMQRMKNGYLGSDIFIKKN